MVSHYATNEDGAKSDQQRSQLDSWFPNNFSSLAYNTASKKAFCKPVHYRFGSSFKNKSEEARFNKVSQEIQKLRHLLINDPQNSHNYMLTFLMNFFDSPEIR